MKWNDENTELLKKLWAEGKSAGQIGCVIEKTRNAVIGKVHRLRLPGRDQSARFKRGRGGITYRPPVKKPRKPALPPADTFASLDEIGAPDVSINRLIKTAIFENDARPASGELPPVVARLKFDELESHHCRMPVGDPQHEDFGFCGDPVALGKPYCPTCCQRAYSPAKPPVKAPHHPKPNTAPASLKRLLQTA